MKKLTLNKAWELCLRQWDWIIKHLDTGAEVSDLKEMWLNDVYRGGENPVSHCFFCEYGAQQHRQDWCMWCPGRLISPQFYCESEPHHYYTHPKKFYKKLLELDKKRKEKNGEF